MNYKIESEFEYKEYKCKVIFMSTGYRFGLVGIPARHPLYRKNHWHLIGIEVHGGLTYSGFQDFLVEEGFVSEDQYWWFGFDCAHLGEGDAIDIESMREYKMIDKSAYKEVKRNRDNFILSDLGEVRTKEFCEDECRKLVDQLYKYGWEI